MQDAHDRMGGSKKPSSGHKEHHKKHKIKWAHFERMLPAKQSHFERLLPKSK